MRTPVPRLLSSSPGCCWLPVIDYLMEWSVEQRTWFGEHRQHGGRNKPRTNRKEVKPALLFLWRRKTQRSRFPSRVIRRYCTAAVEPREEGRGERRGGGTGQPLLQADVWSPPLSKIDRSTERGPAWPWRRSTGSVPLAFTLFLFHSTFMWCLSFLCAAVYCLMIHNSPQSELHSAFRWSAGEGGGHPVISEKG